MIDIQVYDLPAYVACQNNELINLSVSNDKLLLRYDKVRLGTGISSHDDLI